jgi:hypothetical protein
MDLRSKQQAFPFILRSWVFIVMLDLTTLVCRRAVVVALLIAVPLISGCGGGADTVPTFPTKGTLLLDGKPFGPAQLNFKPSHQIMPTPSAIVDSSGNFVVTTFKKGDGAPEGTYTVYLVNDPTANTPAHPMIYNDSESSSLTATVKSGSNDLKIEMSSTAGPSAPTGITGVMGAEGIDPAKAYSNNPATPPLQKK